MEHGKPTNQRFEDAPSPQEVLELYTARGYEVAANHSQLLSDIDTVHQDAFAAEVHEPGLHTADDIFDQTHGAIQHAGAETTRNVQTLVADAANTANKFLSDGDRQKLFAIRIDITSPTALDIQSQVDQTTMSPTKRTALRIALDETILETIHREMGSISPNFQRVNKLLTQASSDGAYEAMAASIDGSLLKMFAKEASDFNPYSYSRQTDNLQSLWEKLSCDGAQQTAMHYLNRSVVDRARTVGQQQIVDDLLSRITNPTIRTVVAREISDSHEAMSADIEESMVASRGLVANLRTKLQQRRLRKQARRASKNSDVPNSDFSDFASGLADEYAKLADDLLNQNQ